MKDAAGGKQYDVTDPQCPGLQLRVRGGAVSWAVRARLHGVQRRRIVGGPNIKPDAARDRANFHLMGDWSEQDADIVWAIPPYMRKRSNTRRAHLNHEVVIVGWTARTVRRLDVLAEGGYYFPVRATRDRLTKNPHADAGFINHALQYMPGVDMSCHGWRRGFASHGQRELGFSVKDIKLILDHSEGAPSGDVTASNYALDPMIAKKREMMEKWIAWLELQVKGAIALDPSLLDAEAVGEAIFRARYGDERWEKRVARAMKHGVGVMEYPFAASPTNREYGSVDPFSIRRTRLLALNRSAVESRLLYR